MKILFSTGCLFHLPIENIFFYAKEAGFDGCDLLIDTKFDSDGYLERVQHCLDILPVYSIHAPFMKMRTWGTKADILARTIDIARTVGAKVVNFHPPSWFAMEVQFFKWFREIKDFQKELGCDDVFLAIENMPRSGTRLMLTSYILNDLKDLVDFGVERNLYFTFDTTHFGTFGDDIIAGFLRVFKTGRLKNIHLSDHGSHRSHLFLGKGDLPIVKFLNTVRRLGYDEMITLEL
ncbi:MAG: sugar phosphate isomerase/epimerase, partial [Syntrophorhabdaceae bacterium]|nr:sugar phosphate isomerase/epimerase [Syntrophorhabdaceae bacterium]